MIVPRTYYDKKIIDIIRHAISDGCESYAEMDDFDKEKLTMHCIAIADCGQSAYTYIIDSDQFDKIVRHLQSYIVDGCIDRAVDLAELLKRNAMQQAETILVELFNEILTDHNAELNRQAGLTRHVDSVNGEVKWL